MWNGLNDAFIAWPGLAMLRTGHQLRITTTTASAMTTPPNQGAVGANVAAGNAPGATTDATARITGSDRPATAARIVAQFSQA